VLPDLVTATLSLPGTVRAPQTAGICIPDRMADALPGTITPSRVVDDETYPDHVGDVDAAMDERRAVNSLIRVGSL
jgi:hypothetical protein